MKILLNLSILLLSFVILSCEKNSMGIQNNISIAYPELIYVARKDVPKDWGTSVSINSMDALGNHHREIIAVSDGYVKDPSFTSDGEKIVFVMHSDSLGKSENLYFINFNGTGLKQITNPDTSLTYFFPQIIPNQNLVFFVVRINSNNFQIRSVDIESREEKVLADAGSSFSAPLVTPDGSFLIFIDNNNLFKMNSDGSQKTQLTYLDNVGNIQISNNSSLIYFVSMYKHGYFDLFSVDLDGNNLKRITNRDDLKYASLLISPNEEKVLYMGFNGNDISTWIMNSDGSNEKLISQYYTWDDEHKFYPESNKIIFYRSGVPDHNSDNHLFSMNIDGSDLEILTQDEYHDNISPKFRPMH